MGNYALYRLYLEPNCLPIYHQYIDVFGSFAVTIYSTYLFIGMLLSLFISKPCCFHLHPHYSDSLARDYICLLYISCGGSQTHYSTDDAPHLSSSSPLPLYILHLPPLLYCDDVQSPTKSFYCKCCCPPPPSNLVPPTPWYQYILPSFLPIYIILTDPREHHPYMSKGDPRGRPWNSFPGLPLD